MRDIFRFMVAILKFSIVWGWKYVDWDLPKNCEILGTLTWSRSTTTSSLGFSPESDRGGRTWKRGWKFNCYFGRQQTNKHFLYFSCEIHLVQAVDSYQVLNTACNLLLGVSLLKRGGLDRRVTGELGGGGHDCKLYCLGRWQKRFPWHNSVPTHIQNNSFRFPFFYLHILDQHELQLDYFIYCCASV